MVVVSGDKPAFRTLSLFTWTHSAMIEVVKRWFENRFHDEEAVILTFILIIGVAMIIFLVSC